VRFAVVGHDAGGAELLCALVKEHFKQADWRLFCPAASPMARIAEKQGLQTIELDNPSCQLSAFAFDALLFATGWQGNSERPFVAYAKSHRLPTLAFLDHWSRYRERFGYPENGWQANLPDFTVLHDEKALGLAKAFQLPRPVPMPNYYLQRLINEPNRSSQQSSLLFLGEPTAQVAKVHYGDENYWGFTQYTALEAILACFEIFACDSLSIRLHPSENAAGYEKTLKLFPHIRVQINPAGALPLTEQIRQAKVVMGFDSMALYIAAHLNKPVISYLPSLKRAFCLPLPASHQLRDLADLQTRHFQPINLETRPFGVDFTAFCELIKQPCGGLPDFR
jgi:hypothetical protein